MPAPTPTLDASPPTEISTDGRISEHVASAECTGSDRNLRIASLSSTRPSSIAVNAYAGNEGGRRRVFRPSERQWGIV